MKKILKTLFALLLASGIFLTCKHDPVVPDVANKPDPNNPNPVDSTKGGDCDPDSVYFQKDILPLLRSNCAQSGCHDPATASDGVILNDYNSIMQQIDPGNLNNSDLYEAITEDDPDKLMPRNPNTGQGEALDPELISMIGKWISQGAMNNDCETGCDTTSLSFSNDVFPIITQNCALPTCHNATGRSPQFVDYQSVFQSIDRIENRAVVNQTMPPGGPLPDCELLILKKWIDDGAPNN